MEKLIVKNFGPIKHAEIELKDVNVFIGPTASGKSTLAKIACILKTLSLEIGANSERFNELLNEYNISYTLTSNSYFRLEVEKDHTTYAKGNFETTFLSDAGGKKISAILSSPINFLDMMDLFGGQAGDNEAFENAFLSGLKNQKGLERVKTYEDFVKLLNEFSPFNQCVYVPAERSFFSTISTVIYSLLEREVKLPKIFKKFGALFEESRNSIKKLHVDFWEIDYLFENNENFISIGDANQLLPLHNSASGFQSTIPLILVIENFSRRTKRDFNKMFVIEEPELNLYPQHQKDLCEYLIEKTLSAKNRIIITTHSPYMLSTIDNLIMAKNVVSERPNFKAKVKSMVSENKWIDYDKVGAYYFDPYPGKGKQNARNIMDFKRKGIAASAIDNVSDVIGNIYEQLLELRYEKGSKSSKKVLR